MPRPLILLAYLNVALDWERLGPIWQAARERDDCRVLPVASRKFLKWSHPKFIADCGEIQPPDHLYLRMLLRERPDALVCATESSTFPHRRAWALTRYANLLRIPSFTVQHGYECIGINYMDDRYGPEIRLAARHVLTWQDPVALPEVFRRRLDGRIIPTGFIGTGPDTADVAALEDYLQQYHRNRPERLLVTENLHWNRYDDTYREAFLSGLRAAAHARPEVLFLVKPHPARNYFQQQGVQVGQENLLLTTDLPDGLRHVSAATLIACCAGLITTPSTTAVDAAVQGRPVLMARDSHQPWAFEPLPCLRAEDEWVGRVNALLDEPAAMQALSARFLRERLTAVTNGPALLDRILGILRA